MAFYTTIRSWSAILVGAFFTAVTGYVLLEDVFRHGAQLTTKHIMTLAVLAGTIYFGHRFWLEARSWRLGTAFGCAALFVAGTVACVLMSAGRNAEVVTNKVLTANAINSGRLAAQKDRDEAKARYEAALTAETSECSSGNGAKCAAKRITRMVRRQEYDEAEVKLRAEKPEQIANADIRAAAELLSRLPFVTANADSVEALLQLLYPFLQSLFCEIGAIVGYSIGLGHGKKPLPKAKATAAELPVSSVQKPGSVQFKTPKRRIELKRVGSVAKTMARIDLLGYIEAHGSTPSQDFLVDRWRRSKGTVSYWLADWERAGIISRQREGKCKVTAKLNRTELN